jgi:diguanylate cyclase (GGDEF)-like protein
MKVLIIEDDPVTRLILCRLLRDRGHEVTPCTTAEEAIEACRATFYPLLFLDLFLPGMDGFSFCRWIRQQPEGKLHLILVGTASDRKEDLRKILDAGADDYIIKPYQADTFEVRLAIAQQRVKNIEIRRTLEANLRQEQERLQFLATHDPLTHLPNRTTLAEKLADSVRASRGSPPSALIYIDLDNFKLINDSLGHVAGDKVLVEVAAVLRNSIRRDDVPSRIGGDEFGILLHDTSVSGAKATAERILSKMQEFTFSNSNKAFLLGASLGIAMIDGSAEAEEVMAFADSACYSAKVRGRGRVEVYNAGDESMAERHQQAPRAGEIREAIIAQRFELLFQPVIDLQTTAASFYEALIRLPSNGKLLLPGTFLPAAERFKLMADMDRFVIRKALSHLIGNKELHLAINLSGQSFADRSLPNFVATCFEAAAVEPERVVFEITETTIISNLPAARTMMHQMRRLGFRFALDDFGAAFSSFSYLKHLVVDYLKIDGSFICDAENNGTNWIFVEIMNDIAHRLKIKSIAEFVEQETTLTKLREIGVDLAQGYLFGEPGPLPDSIVHKSTFQ